MGGLVRDVDDVGVVTSGIGSATIDSLDERLSHKQELEHFGSGRCVGERERDKLGSHIEDWE